MTKTTWTFAPAGVRGQGTADARPYPGVVVCPTPEAVRGTGLPADGFAVDVRGMTGDEIARLRPLTGPVAVLAGTSAPIAQNVIAQNVIAQNVIAQQSNQNDDTTLGLRFPGRPPS
jgi:hypothetical protein